MTSVQNGCKRNVWLYCTCTYMAGGFMYRWCWRFRAALLLSLLCSLIQESHVAVAEKDGEAVTETISVQTQSEQGVTVRTHYYNRSGE